MEPGYITLIILFGMSQAALIIIVVVLVIARNKAQARADRLSLEYFEQYRKYMTKSDETRSEDVRNIG